MKNAKFELFGRMQRQHHLHHPWRLSQGGLFIPHSYVNFMSDSLSWCDDVGFILNKRRVIVWWRHPRQAYYDEIEEQSWKEAGEGPHDNWLTEGSTKNYRQVGKSRKKIVSHTCRQPSDELRTYYDKLRAIEARKAAEGIEFDVPLSWKRKRLNWADSISLVAPMEVRNAADLALVAQHARRLILGQTALEVEFPGYRYGKVDWLCEQKRHAIGEPP
jgi:hypothetical protein